MKRCLWLVVALFSSTTPLAQAASQVTLPVVSRYDEARSPQAFKDYQPTQIPHVLLGKVSVSVPSRAHQAPYPAVFFQNERMVVCTESCDSPSLAKPAAVGPDFELRADPRTESHLIRQANVYYWANRMFDVMEGYGFRPTKRLIVHIDRDVDSPTNGLPNTNNAFFFERNWSLTFLKGKKSFASVGPLGTPAPSANDPAVIIHEAAHSVFEALIGSALNPETFGLHEAFADYLAYVILESPVMGRVMTRGGNIRDESEIRKSTGDTEAHAVGEVVASVLIHLRNLAADPRQADRAVLDAMLELGRKPTLRMSDIFRAHVLNLAFSGTLATSGQLLSAAALEAWESSGLMSPSVEIDPSTLPPLSERKGEKKTSDYWIESPEGSVLQTFWAFPSWERTLVESLGQPIPGPAVDGALTQWILVRSGLSQTRGATPVLSRPLWLLVKTLDQSVLSIVDAETKQPIAEGTNHDDFKAARNAMDVLREAQGLASAATRFAPPKLMRLLVTPGKTKTSAGPSLTLDLGDESIQTEARTRNIHRGLLGKLLGQLGGTDLTQALGLRELGAITLIAPRGKKEVVGMSYRYMTGLRTTLIEKGRLASSQSLTQ